MMWQLKSAARGPLDRLRTSKVVFSFPPSLFEQLKPLVEAVRRARGGEGVYGVHAEGRLALDVVRDDHDPAQDPESVLYVGDDGDEEPWSPGTPSIGGASTGRSSPSRMSPSRSPNKVTWIGPEVSWVHACVRATLAVQVAPESEEYQENAICQEQDKLLRARGRIEHMRHGLRRAVEDALMHDEETGEANAAPWAPEEDTPTGRLRESVERLDKAAAMLKTRMRTMDHRFVTERDALRRLELPGAEGQTFRDDRIAAIAAMVGAVDELEAEVEPVLEAMHKLLENKRHVILQENINHLEAAVVKLKAKYRTIPPEPERGASSKEQDTYKAEKERIEADNKKLDSDIAKREKSIERLTAKLKDDLRTLEKPNPPPAFLMTLSARALARMDSDSFIRWLNWQPESNGYRNANKGKAAASKSGAGPSSAK